MLRSLLIPGLLAGLAASQPPLNAGGTPKHHHHHLHHALFELRHVDKELRAAGHDFGGHRDKALRAVDAAIIQVDRAILAAGGTIPKITKNQATYQKYTHHPHLHHAIHELKEARHELREAKHDFGGHREHAIRDINFAITQLELVLKHARRV